MGPSQTPTPDSKMISRLAPPAPPPWPTPRRDALDAVRPGIVTKLASMTTGAAATSRCARRYTAAATQNSIMQTKNTRRPSRRVEATTRISARKGPDVLHLHARPSTGKRRRVSCAGVRAAGRRASRRVVSGGAGEDFVSNPTMSDMALNQGGRRWFRTCARRPSTRTVNIPGDLLAVSRPMRRTPPRRRSTAISTRQECTRSRPAPGSRRWDRRRPRPDRGIANTAPTGEKRTEREADATVVVVGEGLSRLTTKNRKSPPHRPTPKRSRWSSSKIAPVASATVTTVTRESAGIMNEHLRSRTVVGTSPSRTPAPRYDGAGRPGRRASEREPQGAGNVFGDRRR